jgi:hypothetical protein
MAHNFADGADGDQVFLMPPDPREWLPPQHLAWAGAADGAGAGPGAVPGRLPGRRAGQRGVSPADDDRVGAVLLCQGDPVVAGGGDGHLRRRGGAGDLRRPAS